MDTMENVSFPEDLLPGIYRTLVELGRCYLAAGKLGEAQHCYEKAAVVAPDEAAPYVGLGLIALENSNLSDAEIAFKVARRLDSRCAEAYCGLGTVYHRRE
ncbi:MAG: tetratricopeptide repeat protein, partial [Planctomycetota bacterium]